MTARVTAASLGMRETVWRETGDLGPPYFHLTWDDGVDGYTLTVFGDENRARMAVGKVDLHQGRSVVWRSDRAVEFDLDARGRPTLSDEESRKIGIRGRMALEPMLRRLATLYRTRRRGRARPNPTRVAPLAVRAAAREALELLASGRRCCTPVGIARARQLAAGRPVSDADIVKMCSYFARHAVDKRADWKARATPGYVAWQAWGGDAGRRWACAERARLR